jgi:hypothetical protein
MDECAIAAALRPQSLGDGDRIKLDRIPPCRFHPRRLPVYASGPEYRGTERRSLKLLAANEAIDSLDRCVIGLRIDYVEADRTGLGALRPDDWPNASLASSGISPLSSVLALSCSRKADRVERNSTANSAQEFDEPISTVRSASIRGRGGSTPNRRGGSQKETQRQNFFSAVRRRC